MWPSNWPKLPTACARSRTQSGETWTWKSSWTRPRKSSDQMSISYEPPPSQWVDLDGPVHYVDHGGPADGPLLVCVHGLGGSLVNWAAVAPRLTDTVRLVALDL